MTLQFLVPQFLADDKMIKYLLDSIAIQQNVDMKEIGMIICNDGSNTFLTDEFLKSYPFTIEYYKEPHRGVCATRNFCFDHATADYVMFCDEDDLFQNNCGLSLIFSEIAKKFDYLWSYFVAEDHGNYFDYTIDTNFIHGKVYSREFLIANNIRWNEKLTYHEDYYFNSLCQRLSGKTAIIPFPIYYWRTNPQSVSRQPHFPHKTYPDLVDVHDAIVSELLNRNMEREAQLLLTNIMTSIYIDFNGYEFLSDGAEPYIEPALARVKIFYKKFKPMWDIIPMKMKYECLNVEYLRPDCLIGFESWFKQLED